MATGSIRVFRLGLKMLLLLINLFFAILLALTYFAPYYSPEQFFVPSLLGLFYPVLFIINVGFVVFWLIRFKFYFLLSFITIMAGWNVMIKNFGQGKNSQVDPSTPNFKFLSYNVRLFDQYKWLKGQDYFTRDAIFRFIATESPDILNFQEFFHGNENFFPTIEPFVQLQLANHYHVDYVKVAGDNKHYGLATFSRFPIVGRGAIRFKNSTSNSGIYTDIVINRDTIRVFNFHLESIRFSNADYKFVTEFIDPGIQPQSSSNSKIILSKFRNAYRKRAEQARIATEYIRQSPYPVIVSGDFNDTPVSYVYHTISNGLGDAFLNAGRGYGSTYSGGIPLIRIDYVLHSESLVPNDFTIHKVDFSDHFPVTCLFNLRRSEE